MRQTKTAVLALLAALTACATIASPALATEYHEFEYSKTGGQFEGKALGIQKFKLGAGYSVECNEAKPWGELTTLQFKELPLSMNYRECAKSGIGAATVSTPEYTWLLPTGLQLRGTITLAASGSGYDCRYAIPGGQSLGSNAGEVEYENSPNGVIIDDKVKGVAYEIVESNSAQLCGGTIGEEGTNGSIAGEFEVGMSNGTMKVR